MEEVIIILLSVAVAAALITLFYSQRINSRKLAALTGLKDQAERERDLAAFAREQAELQAAQLKQELLTEREEKQNSLLRISAMETTLQHYEQRLLQQKEEVETLQKKFSAEFENLANKILEEKAGKFTEQNRANLDQILNPLKEKIRAFEEKVETAYKLEAAERNSLKGEIKNLVELNKKISDEANHLATALKGDTRQQGNWGEFVLEKILEHSGLEKGREYELQFVTENSEGDRIKPDAVIHLPDDKHLIIDAKVSLKAYHDMIAATDENSREQALKLHLTSVKNHIRQLGEKYYQTARGTHTPDFILMFMPVESSFSAAIRADQEIFSYAWDRKIVVVSPTTLLATLRTVASIWKQERQTRHAMQIAEEGGRMYDKLVLLMEDLVKLGRKIKDADEEYSAAMKKLFEGSGNLVRRAEKMKELGAKTSKSLPQQIIEKAE